MRRMKWLVGLMLVLMIYPVLAQQGTGTPSVYRYAYISDKGLIGDTFVRRQQLNLIDPAQPETLVQTIDLPDFMYICGHPSPDGHWLMVCYTDPNIRFAPTTGLMVMDMLTGAIHPVYDIVVDSDDLSDYRQPQWSPDSRYLAFNAIDGKGSSEVYLYSLDDFSLHLLLEPESIAGQDGWTTQAYFRRWSPDSQSILLKRVNCHDQSYGLDCYLTTLDVVRTADSQTIFTVDLFNKVGDEPCNFLWSPGGRYISFRPYCDYLGMGIPFYEVLIWDIQQNRVEQLTEYTNPPPPWTERPPERYADFYPLWYDDQTLMIGVSGAALTMTLDGYIQDNFFVRSEVYHLPDKNPIQLSESRVEAWAKNPASDRLAFISEDMALGDDLRPQASNPQVSIGQFDGQQLHTSVTISGGCDDLAWSPDGMYLSYTEPIFEAPLPNCLSASKPAKIFFTNTQGVVASHNLPPETYAFMMTGWVMAPQTNAIIPYFPAGTPTPIPTLGGMG